MARILNVRRNADLALSFSDPFYAIPTSEAQVEATKVASLRRNALTETEYFRALLRLHIFISTQQLDLRRRFESRISAPALLWHFRTRALANYDKPGDFDEN